MSLTSQLSPSTWRLLGLYIGTSYIGLGTTYILFPTFSAQVFGFLPQKSQPAHPTSAPSQTTSPTTSTSASLPDTLVNPVMQSIAVRDISIGIAILTFCNDGDNMAMGKVVLSGMLIAVVDGFVLGSLGRGNIVPWLAGAAVGWAGIGVGLVGW